MPTVENSRSSMHGAGRAEAPRRGNSGSESTHLGVDVEEGATPVARDFAMTLQEVASELGVSREYVGQLERAAMKKIRARLAAQGWRADMFDWP